MKKVFQKIIYIFSASRMAVLVYKICAKLCEVMIRLASIAKAQAMFPDSKDLILDVRSNFKYLENIKIGDGVIIGSGCSVGAMAPINIGDLVRISRGVTLESATLDFGTPLPYKHIAKPISIEKGVWLGNGVTVLGGVTIGEGAVIGAGAVIAKDVAPWAIIVGSPNRHIRNLMEKVE